MPRCSAPTPTDELAVARNTGGRSSYRNVASARREGVEAGAKIPLGHDLRLQMAYTYLDATYRSAYLICVDARMHGAERAGSGRHAHSRRGGTPGTDAPGMDAGRLDFCAGVRGHQLAECQRDRNGCRPRLRVAACWTWAATGASAAASCGDFARLENLLDRNYVGSVIVNEGNGRFYEAGPERSITVGAQWQWR